MVVVICRMPKQDRNLWYSLCFMRLSFAFGCKRIVQNSSHFIRLQNESRVELQQKKRVGPRDGMCIPPKSPQTKSPPCFVHNRNNYISISLGEEEESTLPYSSFLSTDYHTPRLTRSFKTRLSLALMDLLIVQRSDYLMNAYVSLFEYS